MRLKDLRETVKGGKLDPFLKWVSLNLRVKRLRHTIVKMKELQKETQWSRD